MITDFGKLIVLLRTQNGLSQSELADKIYCSRQYISMVENGKRALHNEYLIPLSLALNFNLTLFTQSIHKYKSVDHFYLAYELIDLIDCKDLKDCNEIDKMLQNEIIDLEFNYEGTIILKKYCQALVEMYVNNDHYATEKILLSVINLKTIKDINKFTPTFNIEHHYYSSIVLLSCVLCKTNRWKESSILLIKTLDFIEYYFFNNDNPISAVDSYYKKLYVGLLNNSADILFNNGELNDAIIAVNKALNAAFEYNTHYYTEYILKLKCEILYKLGQIDEANSSYIEFKFFCQNKKNMKYLLDTNKYFNNEYSLLEMY